MNIYLSIPIPVFMYVYIMLEILKKNVKDKHRQSKHIRVKQEEETVCRKHDILQEYRLAVQKVPL